jgi:2-C-methyl-D-erythritol 4-phosphate cytidylyltransferase
MSAVWAVIAAAGSGTRFASAIPKQHLRIGNKTVLEHCIDRLLSAEEIAGAVIALADEQQPLPASSHQKPVLRCRGGAQRADSVRAGVQVAMAEGATWIAVHDAARPCLSQRDLQALLAARAQSPDGVILAQPVADTIKLVAGDRIERTLDRAGLWQAQTPQIFPSAPLAQALEAAMLAGTNVTDEASAVEALGKQVRVIAARDPNPKITWPHDYAFARLLLAEMDQTRTVRSVRASLSFAARPKEPRTK